MERRAAGIDPSHYREFERVGPEILSLFPDVVRDLGGDPELLFGHVGIDPSAFRDGDAGVSYRQMIELVGLAAVELGCSDFGMRLACRQAGSIQTPLLQLVRNSSTLGDALDHVVHYSFAHSRAAAIWLRRCPEEQTVQIGHDILIEGLSDTRQAIEQILLIEYLTHLEVTAGFARARRVEFRHHAISEPARYRAHFGCEVRFGQAADAIVYGEQVMGLPIAVPDAGIQRNIIAGIDAAFSERAPPLRASVRGIVLHLLAGEGCTSPGVAAALGLHARSLHRALRREGTSFQRIKNQVRRDLLVHYLDHSGLMFSEISQRLGFAEQSAMTRFCRQWLGASPRERRKAAGAKVAG